MDEEARKNNQELLNELMEWLHAASEARRDQIKDKKQEHEAFVVETRKLPTIPDQFNEVKRQISALSHDVQLLQKSQRRTDRLIAVGILVLLLLLLGVAIALLYPFS